ncbi:dihydroneopterin aldolase [Jannaschia seohaensis]|uniref:dihydroneopterin aldolase n=1 Tax=Jannaschia seohaensis TaxID=475081 RepID=A0A2Y9ARX7_9RHOB|nr:dihydroneopterin aldolase [Jannaschia seohaensis]PWJ18310.1 dihydroneopterin aldolase [Jannaschia seohaensis]SSA46835.1 dihydroneopterin aldolase [Jannaschia seohaensis]
MTTQSDRAALDVAFADPLTRAEADPAATPRDRIALREHIREVEIGAFQQERGVTQRIRFDIVCEVTLDAEAVADDDVDGILSYDTLIDAISAELEAERVNLLETLAERIATRILWQPHAARVFVRIDKLDRGPHVLGIEIVRSRTDAPQTAALEGAAPRPRVVLLGPGMAEAPGLPAMIDRLTAADAPAILCVTPDFSPPRAGAPLAQRRIDLLALEQAAWQLAARDARCVVIDSRTELDWALRQGNLSVWAPSRMILDATEGPGGADPLALTRWLAEAFDAVELVLVGAGPGRAHERAVATPEAL